MAAKTHLDIVSAEREIYSGPVEMVVATGDLGEIGVIAGHAPLLAVLKPGEIRVIPKEGTEEIYYVSGGMLEVQPYHVTVLADEVERAADLDEAAAIEAKREAEKAMSSKQSEIDYSKAAAELARAVAQIRAIQKIRKHMK